MPFLQVIVASVSKTSDLLRKGLRKMEKSKIKITYTHTCTNITTFKSRLLSNNNESSYGQNISKIQ